MQSEALPVQIVQERKQMKPSKVFGKKSGHPRFIFLIVAAVATMVALPMIFQSGTATTSAHDNLRPALIAPLTGDPIADVTPRGFSGYFVDATATPDPIRVLTVSVSNVNLPSGTGLTVSLNSTAIGTITLGQSWPGHGAQGSLRLSTLAGDAVPDVASGDTLTVGADNVTYLTGIFAAPPTPSPTSTHTPWPTPSHTPWPTPSHTPWQTPSGTPTPAPSPRAFAARLSGANEVPPVTTDGQGFGFVALNSAETQIRVCLAYRNLSSDVTAITINGPASTTENGPVIFTLTLPTNSFGFSSQTFDVTPEQVADLRAGLWYFQVSTTNNADGEIRGQINRLTLHNGGGHHGGGGGGGDLSGDGTGDTGSDMRSQLLSFLMDIE